MSDERYEIIRIASGPHQGETVEVPRGRDVVRLPLTLPAPLLSFVDSEPRSEEITLYTVDYCRVSYPYQLRPMDKREAWLPASWSQQEVAHWMERRR